MKYPFVLVVFFLASSVFAQIPTTQMTPAPRAGDDPNYNDIQQTQEMQKQTELMRSQTRLMQQQYQDQKNQQAAQSINQITQNNSALQSNVQRYANYPDVLDAMIELQEAKMAYLNTQQTRMNAGTGAAAFEQIADAIRSKKARKRVSSAEKTLHRAIQAAEKCIASGNC